MLWRIKTINGIKKKIPISNPAPQGYPVGTIIQRYKKICPRNCVYLDGRDTTGTAEELETVYPALYMFLGGTNVLPDYRECAMVGAEQNTTDTIATHDVYTEGQFKDDQIQNIKINPRTNGYDVGVWNDGSVLEDNSPFTEGTPTAQYGAGGSSGVFKTLGFDASKNVRTGTTTHGKQKAVYYYMVAVEGVMIADENDFINVVKAYIDSTQSYSTTEHWTGKYWKDGKKIYSKTIDCGALPNATTKTIAHSISNLGRFTKVEAISITANNNTLMLPYVSPSSLSAQVGFTVDATNIEIRSASNYSSYEFTDVTLEYTKTV